MQGKREHGSALLFRGIEDDAIDAGLDEDVLQEVSSPLQELREDNSGREYEVREEEVQKGGRPIQVSLWEQED